MHGGRRRRAFRFGRRRDWLNQAGEDRCGVTHRLTHGANLHQTIDGDGMEREDRAGHRLTHTRSKVACALAHGSTQRRLRRRAEVERLLRT